MNYKETVDYLFAQLPMFQRQGKAAYKANLDNTLALDAYFNHPHKRFKTIHVAGTNGKGSTSHMLAAILAEAGYKTGLYTSPHLKDFRERIKINGHMIPENEVVDFVASHKIIFQELKPSFFEMTVALAFDYFAREKVDIAIIEVGLGGRLDSTNIISPLVSVITNIGLDHTDLLGDTIELIAAEKAGVIKPNTPVVISQSQTEIVELFQNKAQSVGASIHFADQIYKVTALELENYSQRKFSVTSANGQTSSYLLDLPGIYQQKNLAGVLNTIDIVKSKGYNITQKNIEDGLANAAKTTGLKGRWQVLSNTPVTICDTGHNVDGIKEILLQLAQLKYNRLHVVFGMVGDKNVDGVLELMPKDAIYYFTKASIPRAMDEKILEEKAAKFGLRGTTYPNVETAAKFAKKNAQTNDLIFIGGSTFIVADIDF